jgi:hypothetical protein
MLALHEEQRAAHATLDPPADDDDFGEIGQLGDLSSGDESDF